MGKVETESVQLKAIRDEGIKELEKLQKEMEKALQNKSGDAKTKVIEDYRARAQVVQGNMANRMKNQLDSAVHQIAQKHGLGAVLAKQAVPDGGTAKLTSVGPASCKPFTPVITNFGLSFSKLPLTNLAISCTDFCILFQNF